MERKGLTAGMAVAVLALSALAPLADGASNQKAYFAGMLDRSFGDDGRLTTRFGKWGVPAGVAITSGGKIVVAGTSGLPAQRFALARYLVNGKLDHAFGAGGRVRSNIAAQAVGLALQPDGKILVAGSGAGGFELARFRSDGSLDSAFGHHGIVTSGFSKESASDRAAGIALQEDGKIVVAGTSFGGSESDFAVARYLPNGSLDPSFGSGGKATTDFSAGFDEAHAVIIQPDGEIVVAGGSAPPDDSHYAFALARYRTDGSLDASFGSDGKVITAFNPSRDSRGWVQSIAPQADGRIVVAGLEEWDISRFDCCPYAVLARYRNDGSPDQTFGSSGMVDLPLHNHIQGYTGIAIGRDGRIVAAGRFDDDNRRGDLVGVRRYRSDGTPDRSFGVPRDGVAATQFAVWSEDYPKALALDRRGKIVVVGEARLGYHSEFGVLRFLGNAPYCVVPRVKGRVLRVARNAILSRYCKARIHRASSTTVAKGRVIEQHPRAGTKNRAGSRVYLLVSKGPRH